MSNSAPASLFRTSTRQVVFASSLSARMKSGQPLYDPDLALIEDADWWSRVLRDPKIGHAIRQRLAKVVRRQWNLEPGGDDAASLGVARVMEEMFREIRYFSASRRHLAKFAFHGNAQAWIEGKREWKSYGATRERPIGYLQEFWRPTFLRPLDKRQVLLVPIVERRGDKDETVRIERRIATIDGGKHMPLVHPECLISAVYDDEVERLGSGRGLGEAVYHGYWIKGQVRQEYLRGVVRWAQGVPVAKIDQDARAEADKSTADIVEEAAEALKTMGQGGAFVIGKTDDLEVLFGGEGASTALEAMKYEDDEVTQLCLGALLPTGMNSDVGSGARAETEQDSTDDLLDTDRELLDEVLTHTLVKLTYDLNEAAFAACGLGGASLPRFNSVNVSHEDPEEAADVLKSAQELGLEVGEEEAYRRVGVAKPAKGEPTLKRPAPSFGPPGQGAPFQFTAGNAAP